MMKKNVVKFLAGLICSFFFMNNVNAVAPTWTFEMSAGLFEPEDEKWSSYYGSTRMLEGSVSLARRFFSVLDLGVAVNYGLDKGTGVLPKSNLKAGSVTYEEGPVDLYLLFRGRFVEGQWIVPYVGGGYTRFNYRQTIKDQGETKGGLNGQHIRGGLQFLLDPLDTESSREIYRAWGVINSYLYLEARQTTADLDNSIKLGGLSYKMGLMLEY